MTTRLDPPGGAASAAGRGGHTRRILGLTAAVAAFLVLAFVGVPLAPARTPPAFALATAAFLVVAWSTAALPLWVSALAPLVVFPLAGVLPGGPWERAGAAAAPYADAYVVVFLGGMAIAAGLQETGLSRRIAAAILVRAGSSPGRILAGLFAATAVTSMWVSNTAAATLVLPVALALLAEIEPRAGRNPRFAAALVLAVAWGANVGGIGTRVGTPTNMQLSAFLSERGLETTFAEFSAIGLGFVVLFAPLAVLYLVWHARRDAPPRDALSGVVRAVVGTAGPWSRGERTVAGVFAATAAAWIAAGPIAEALRVAWPGLAVRTKHVEATAAVLACVALLVLRPKGRALLSRASVRAMPWAALLLIGGSFALAQGIETSGLDAAIQPLFAGLADLAPLAQTLAVAGITVLVSAFASNTATVAILLPLLAAAAPGAREATLLFAAGIASSCDFALPAGTPPNAIAFASGRVPFGTMLSSGIALDVVAACVAGLWCHLAVPLVLG
ncbi:MAG: anion permease [Planctomycetes bacterium]|nr:anion permease [Planctomycetota bacterium]